MRSVSIFLFLTLAFAFTGCSGNTPQNNAVPPVSGQAAASPVKSSTPAAEQPGNAPAAGSIYTELSEKACKDIPMNGDDEGLIYKGECPGTAGYKVINMSTDHTQGLRIIDPAGKAHKVDLRGPMNTVADVFLGDKIEWRTKASKPYAFIVRVNVQKEPGNYDKQDSNLAVVKIANDAICVTDFVKPSEKDQNVKARELSDTAAGRPCIKSKME